MLSRLDIRQKLALLLTIPLLAALAAIVLSTSDRVARARAASATLASATAAREVGVLIQDLQQERLIALGYLNTTQLDRSAMLAQSQTAIDDAARLRDNPATAQVLTRAAQPLAAIALLRARVTARTAAPGEVLDAFRAANGALLDALELFDTPGADAEGLRQLAALDAFMRANEEASKAGAVLVALAGGQPIGTAPLTDALAAQEQQTARFRQLVSQAQETLLDLVEQGQAGQRISQLVAAARRTDGGGQLQVVDALTAAVSYTGLRRVVQDRIAREIANGAEQRASAAAATAAGVGGAAALVLVVVIVLGIMVSRSISGPLRRLTVAASGVADLAGDELVRVADSDDPAPAPPRLAELDIRGTDEIGALAEAFNRVQSTAAMLIERQVAARRNIGVMFANIARRTQNLVGRQVVVIDGLHRDPRAVSLAEPVHRLGQLATRLRRSSDSLLVVSGTVDPGVAGAPTRLRDLVELALTEVEGGQGVQVPAVADVAVSAGLVNDLRLLLAELVENAVSFSPPGSPIQVSAALATDCYVQIVDHGLGMTPARLAEENRRLVGRERLDVAPTTLLGLFVVGRIARRHGLTVLLDHSAGQGITATVKVPRHLLRPAAAAVPLRDGRLAPPPREILAVPAASSGEPFGWFDARRGLPAGASAALQIESPKRPATAVGSGAAAEDGVAADGVPSPAANAYPGAVPAAGGYPGEARPDGNGSGPTRAGLNRRIPGTHLLPMHATTPRPSEPAVSGDVLPPSSAMTRGGLTRRVPGTHLAGRVPTPGRPVTPAAPAPRRDPEAERAALDGFMSGFARGAEARPTEQERQP